MSYTPSPTYSLRKHDNMVTCVHACLEFQQWTFVTYKMQFYKLQIILSKLQVSNWFSIGE